MSKWKVDHHKYISGFGSDEWWEVTDGNTVFRADTEKDAVWLCTILQWETS